MFTLDFAEDFSGLTDSQIRELEKKGILKPLKESGVKYYTYGDIYVLRCIKILNRIGIKKIKINNAFTYLSSLSSEQPLTSFSLLHDNKEVYAIDDTKNLVAASKWGQRILEGVLDLVAVGTELEATRQKMNKFVSETKHRARNAEKAKGKVYTVQDLGKLFG